MASVLILDGEICQVPVIPTMQQFLLHCTKRGALRVMSVHFHIEKDLALGKKKKKKNQRPGYSNAKTV